MPGRRLSSRLQRMVSQTRGMEIVTTNSEAEALLLEAQLIKRFRPPYNVLLRDDKSFPFILLRADHAFPRIMKHRGARKAKGDYYGPFASAGSVNTTINALQKLFLLRSCTDSFFARRDRPCLLYQIKRCSAPVRRAGSTRRAMPSWSARRSDFLGGKIGRGAEEDRGADGRRRPRTSTSRRAAMLRDRLRAATFIQGSQAINAEGVGNADVFAMAAKGGQIGGPGVLHPRRAELGPPRLLPEPHRGARARRRCWPASSPSSTRRCRRRAASWSIASCPSASCWPRRCASAPGGKVEISVPQRGDRRRLIAAGQRNAVEALDRRLAESGTKAKHHARTGRVPRTGRSAAADRGLRQQPYPGHQRAGRDDRRRAGGLPQGPVPQVQHQDRADQRRLRR